MVLVNICLLLSTVANHQSVADPGFPVGGGGVDLRHGRFSVKMYAVGGGGVHRKFLYVDPTLPVHLSHSLNYMGSSGCSKLYHIIFGLFPSQLFLCCLDLNAVVLCVGMETLVM